MCCTRLAETTIRKKSPKIRHLGTIAQLCRAVSLQLRHVSTIGRKLVKQQYLLHMSPQYGELRPTNGWDRFWGLGHPSKFQCVSHLAFVTAASSLTRGEPNFARCLAVSWAATLYIHFRRLLPPDGILSGAKFTLRLSLAFSYIGSTPEAGVSQTLRRDTRNGSMELSQRAPPIFGWAAITFGISPHSSSHRLC